MNNPTPASTKSESTVNPRKALGITAATLLLGGTAWAISQKIVEKTGHKEQEVPTEGAAPDTGSLPGDIDVAGKVTDDMSFEQAFTAARNEVGLGGVFGWHGHWYNTFEKDEWTSLSLEQRQEYTEMIAGEKLPVTIYHQPASNAPVAQAEPAAEPTAIEGTLNGQPVIGLDYNHDGVIDVLVMDSGDGHIYRVIDAAGDDGLDTVYRYDSLDGQLTAVVRLDQSVVLSNDQFSQALEESMSKEVVDSILEPNASVPSASDIVDEQSNDEVRNDDEDDDSTTDSHDSGDDTYVNDGDVHDMDE